MSASQDSNLTDSVQFSRRARYAPRDMLKLFSSCPRMQKMHTLGRTLTSFVSVLQDSLLTGAVQVVDIFLRLLEKYLTNLFESRNYGEIHKNPMLSHWV